MRVIAYDIPKGCMAYPECNPLLPFGHHEEEAKTPAAKSFRFGSSRVQRSPRLC